MPHGTKRVRNARNLTAKFVAAARSAERTARAHATMLKGHLSALKVGMPKFRSLSKSRSRNKNGSRKA
jgi:ATP-dependent DNA ligase